MRSAAEHENARKPACTGLERVEAEMSGNANARLWCGLNPCTVREVFAWRVAGRAIYEIIRNKV